MRSIYSPAFLAFTAALLAPAGAALADDPPSTNAHPMVYGAPAGEAGAITLSATGRYGGLAMLEAGPGFVLDMDAITVSGPPGKRTADITIVEAVAVPIHGTSFRVTRGHLSCVDQTHTESASRLFDAAGAPQAWLPAPGDGESNAPPAVWQMLFVVACSGAQPEFTMVGYAEVLRQTRARSYADADFVRLPPGPLGLMEPPAADRRGVRLMVLGGPPRGARTVVEVTILTLNPGGDPAKYGSAYAVTRLRVDCAARSVFTLGGAGYDAVGEVTMNIVASDKPAVLPRSAPSNTALAVACGDAQPAETVTGYSEAMRRFGAP